MKLVTFCCLLAFYVFDLAQAITKDVHLYDLEDQVNDDLYKLVTSKQTEFKVALKGATQKKETAACENEFNEKVADFVVNSVAQYLKCQDDGRHTDSLTKVLSISLDCDKKYFQSSRAVLDSYVTEAKTCLGNEGKPKSKSEGKPKREKEAKHEGNPEGQH